MIFASDPVNPQVLISLLPARIHFYPFQILVDNKPGSNFRKAEQFNVLYTKDGKILKGSFLNKAVAFPDYSSSKVREWFRDFYNTEIAFLNPDGLILRNSWPVNNEYNLTFGDKIKFFHMSQEMQSALSQTLPWDSLSSSSKHHIDVHNSYGSEFADVVASQTGSSFILSGAFTQTSHYPTHIQNTDATWVNFKMMLRKTLSHSLFGGPLFSVPVCGDTAKFSLQINQGVCTRWYLTASTMPLFRISSVFPRRSPNAYNDARYVKNIMIDAIRKRYSLLPFYYTVLSENLPMVRPMFYNYPNDNETFYLDEQYMIGEALLIAQPSLFPTPNMRVYLPKTSEGWYDFWGGKKFTQAGWLTVPMTEGELIAFIPAGHVVPMRDGIGNSVEETLDKPLKLVVALDCSAKEGICNAKGTMFFGSSITLEFLADNEGISILHAKECASGTNPDFVISLLKLYDNNTRYLRVPEENSQFCINKNSNIRLLYSQLSSI